MLPNLVSLVRIVLLPPLLWSLHRDGQVISGLTLLMLTVAVTSDTIDGWLARRLGQSSRLGQILDPLADKILLGGLAVGLVWWQGYPAWLLALLLTRDLAIVAAGSFLLQRRGVVIPASRLGKASTVAMTVTILACVLSLPALLQQALALGAAVLLASSGLGYLREARRGWRRAGVAPRGPGPFSGGAAA